ncbi:hypothetical protein MAR_028150 [Mya arenaria]|uniref:Uncharacterized protein n=1 Tax=Mya arenaria TaxID=6604 RepID=A0ABY7DFH4_MYAAR|nr:hypothetical protein MAR_028150 [Mya arenaria]
MAKWNKKPVVNFERMVRSVEKSLSGDEDAKYSVIVLFRKRPLLRLTVPLMLSCSYPSIFRIGRKFTSIIAYIVCLVGGLVVTLEELVPGLLYIMIALLSFLSILCIVSLPETNHRMLVDRLVDDLDRERKQEKDHVDTQEQTTNNRIV